MFTRMLEQARRTPAHFADLAGDLFRVMASGGRVGFETVDWFSGGLFDDDTVLPLERSDIDAVLAASNLDWSEIDPSILGTLFERGLDPDKPSGPIQVARTFSPCSRNWAWGPESPSRPTAHARPALASRGMSRIPTRFRTS